MFDLVCVMFYRHTPLFSFQFQPLRLMPAPSFGCKLYQPSQLGSLPLFSIYKSLSCLSLILPEYRHVVWKRFAPLVFCIYLLFRYSFAKTVDACGLFYDIVPYNTLPTRIQLANMKSPRS